ncbi:hypothetical protein SDC9_209291 [bioreactor metagenome]|uniref:Uncharacterized protein n=1 Tax=bioreactor metagenome TaxID=1076179 RepID=A0A645JPQ6_9ZZZZ
MREIGRRGANMEGKVQTGVQRAVIQRFSLRIALRASLLKGYIWDRQRCAGRHGAGIISAHGRDSSFFRIQWRIPPLLSERENMAGPTGRAYGHRFPSAHSMRVRAFCPTAIIERKHLA